MPAWRWARSSVTGRRWSGASFRLERQDWLADYLEDDAALNPEFVASIERGKADLREGWSRRRQP